MKIKLLDIKGFGKFNQLKITPKDGFNIIFENNESGKSTLQAFIRAMLYGLRGGRRSRDGSLPPLKHNKPWKGDQYAGIIEYTLENGKTYRVGRNFEKVITNIYDDAANNLTTLFPQDKETGPKFAEEHLGLDEAAFERSVFIGQLQSVIDDVGKKNLIEKLSNLNTTGSEDLSLTGAINILESTLLERVGTKNSTTRPLDKINNRISELENEKIDLENQYERFMGTISDLRQAKNLLTTLNEKLEDLNSKKEAIKKGELLSLKNELDALIRENSSIDEQLRGCNRELIRLKPYENIDEDTVSDILFMLREEKQIEDSILIEQARLKEIQEKYDELAESLDSEELFKKKTNDVQEAIEIYNEAKNQARNYKDRADSKKHVKIKRNWLPFIVPAGLLSSMLLIAYYFYKSNPLFLGAAAIIGIFTATIFFININKQSRNSIESFTDTDKLNMILSKSGFIDMVDYIRYRESQVKGRELKNSYSQQILSSKEHLENLLAKKSEIFKSWLKFIKEYGLIDDSDKIKVIGPVKKSIEDFRKAGENKQRLLGCKENINDKCEMVLREAGMLAGEIFLTPDDLYNYILSFYNEQEIEIPQISKAYLEKAINETENRIKDARLNIATLEARLEQAPNQSELCNVLEELSSLKEKKEALELKGSSLTLASQVLKEVALNLQKDYIPELNREMSKMMKKLSSGRYNKVLTNDELKINLEVPETEELIPVNRLSGGTIDQVYFSMRLAAVTLIERGGDNLPIFLDEPFSQYDETRVKKAFELLKEISEERQVFFFTCREREYEIASEVFGQDMNRIRL